MKRFLVAIGSIRSSCEIFAVLLFVLFWPAANLYWAVCGALGAVGKAIGVNGLGGALGAISVFMAFLVPFWAVAVMGAYYLATALAVVSLRPVPVLLLLVAWLEMNRFIPAGHIQLDDVPKIYQGEFNWSHPLLYSALAILGGSLVAIASRREAECPVR